MNSRTYMVAVVCLICLSCNDSEKGHSSIASGKVIPYHEDSSVHHTRQALFLQNLGNIIGLTPLSHGKEGLYIRIWIWDTGKEYVININDDHDKKECNVIAFNSKKMDTGEYIVLHNEWVNLKPKSGWDNFFIMLKKYQIASLKSGKSFDEQTEHLTRMTYVQFEIAQFDQYRFYEYLEPSFYRYVDTGSGNVYEFLEYFNDEMNLQIYNPKKKLFVKPT